MKPAVLMTREEREEAMAAVDAATDQIIAEQQAAREALTDGRLCVRPCALVVRNQFEAQHGSRATQAWDRFSEEEGGLL